MNNKVMIHPTPIPIETCLSKEDARRDDKLFNRFWFKYPAEWFTANNNENIIGVRSVHFLKPPTQYVNYTVVIRKYLREDFKQACIDAKNAGVIDIDLEHYLYHKASADIIEKVWRYMNKDKVSELTIPAGTVVKNVDPIQQVCEDFNAAYVKYANAFNEKYGNTKINFVTDSTDIYKHDVFMETKFMQFAKDKTYTNLLSLESELNDFVTGEYCLDIKFEYIYSNTRNVFNVITNAEQYDGTNNYMDNLMKYAREQDLIHVWDRKSCKLYSSLASQANKNYLCNSDVHFNPIKYFIVKATDTEFYIDFYSAYDINVPIKFPPNVNFFIELQLMQNKKLLYI